MDEILLNVAHHLQREFGGENAGVLALILLEDVGLHRATHVGQHPLFDLFDLVVGGRPVIVAFELLDLLIERRVEKNIARIIGAGPLMVMDTEVVGQHRSKPEYNTFRSSRVAMETPELPTLP